MNLRSKICTGLVIVGLTGMLTGLGGVTYTGVKIRAPHLLKTSTSEISLYRTMNGRYNALGLVSSIPYLAGTFILNRQITRQENKKRTI